MANGTRSTRRDKDDEEDNNSKGSLNSGKKFVNSGATTAEASGVRRSPRETPSRKNMTPASSSNTRKSERLEKQSSNSNSLTPPAKRKFERIEKQTDPSPLRRSERSKMASSSGSSGSKKSDKSPDSLEMKRKKEKKEKSVKQLTMETLEVEKIDKEDKQTREGTDRRRDARSYRALLGKDLKNPTTGDHSDNRNRTDVEKRDKGLLGEQTERTLERTVMTSASQSVKEALESNTEHKLPSTSQNDSGKYIFSNGDSRQVSKSGLAKEVNGDAEKAVLENLQKEKAVCDSAKQGACSSNTKLNQFFEPSDSKDRRKLNSSSNTGDVEKPCNDMQTHISSTDLQRGDGQNICIVCKVGAKLLSCILLYSVALNSMLIRVSPSLCCEGKGCQRSYHLSCLEPPLKEFPLGVWLCPICVRKKIESGVHSVSEGIEAIWDSREVEASQGLQRQKQYFVQYKGLAHVHNRWVPENQVLLEAPSLVAKYNRRNQGAVWKQQWAVPHRVLQKRLLTTSKESDEQHHHKGHDGHKLDCHVEWLVKWRGLGYEHASWELENAPFLSCQEGQSLIQDYETRRKKAKTASKFDKEHAQERTEVAFPCSQLPAGVSSRLNANLDAVNKLCNYWRKGQNAIIFDDQERIPNVISFILSFLSYNSRPFLIISTSASQYSWEEFFHLAPSADVVVYSGSKEIRESIRSLEFYEERGGIMFQVLITSPEVISEDLNVLDCIGWEAIIVDECQRPRITSCFEQIKLLTARRRLLIVSGQLKDNMAEYLNLLSLLDSQSNSNDSDGLLINSSDVIGILKERLAKYIAYGESPRFVEYWVPVQLSNVQLEKYCFTLLSNSLSLCSPSRTDPVGAVRNILITCRKCCDHPYVVDESLQALLTKDLQMSEFLDVGIKASGKLQLLDAMLSDIKKRELKVLILVQSIGGSGRELMGDILDDFVRQRFGADSYERVESGLTSSKKQSAMNKFNNERQRFVFLLETRACLPSIKLSAIGIVIIFGSDWSPMNDLKALNKITLDSQFEQIKVFRLYSSFTVEEKVLMFSKQDKTLDSNIQSVSPSTSHMLLKWGASYLFSQLDKFHGMPTLDEGSFSEQSYLKDVIKEFFIILDQTEIDNDASMLSLILQAKQNRGNYRTEMPLFGEQRLQVMNEDPPHIFWMKLLEGKSPQWKYSSCSSQRIRKRVQHFDPEAETAEGVKKRKKVASDCNDLSPKAGLHEDKMVAGDREGSSESLACGLSHSFSRPAASGSDKVHSTSNSLHLVNNMSQLPALDMAELEDRRKQRDLQKNLHGLLKPQMAKLCEVLHLSEDVKAIVEKFLEYVMNNHRVSREPAAILQAFQISLVRPLFTYNLKFILQLQNAHSIMFYT
ncbi:hypothetical protein COLO4_18304 [Corchorus olitorius]|uniref:SNF2-related protein n=1 Tax=Corchorus olitorius TaxID=93759 RepID=A0A1R3J9N6_9ROSI|nr:hypothetical protein COLO4_18304 [Corchorus olitorius]